MINRCATRSLFQRARRRVAPLYLAIALVSAATSTVPSALAQQSTPVYVDDSVAARESLARVEDLVSTGNLAEAARILQAVLDTESDRVLESQQDSELFLSVRELVHRRLRATPALLDRYRLSEGPRAQRALDSGDAESTERARLFTTAGFDAALTLARARLLEGRFEASRLVLAQLELHPDRSGERAVTAAALAVQIARYLPRDEVRQWASQWTTAAGKPAPTSADFTPATVPARAQRVQRSPMSQQDAPPPWTGESTIKPLVSTLVGTQFNTPRDDWEVALADMPQRSEDRGNAWLFPTISGDVVYTNDGVEITAYDRITLSILWRSRPPNLLFDDSSYEERRGRVYRPDYVLDDVSSVAVSSGVIVGTSGLAMGSSRRGDPRVHAYSSDGQWLWSVDIESLSPQFESSSVRGEIIIDGDTAVVPIRKRATSRRISSAYMVALDLYTGQMKWSRLLGSAGSLPSAARDRIADSPLLHQGLIIHTDGLGVISAIEAANGRVAWARRFRGEPVYRSSLMGEFTPVWCVNRPIADGSGVIAIQPGGENLLRLDLSSGTVTHTRPLAFVGDPRCAFRVGQWLCFPAAQRMTFIPAANIQEGEATSSLEFAPGTLKGRPIATDRQLMVPTASGIAVIDPASPKESQLIPIAAAGNVVITDGTIIAADQTRLHLFVEADRAMQTLQARATRNPDAPLPQIELVDLAFRATRYEQIIAPADRALQLLAALPAAEAAPLRHRLFTSLSGIVRRALGETGSLPSAAAPIKPRTPVGLEPPMNIALVAAIVERLGTCASTPNELVEHLFLAARADESRTAGASAMARYQTILSDPALAAVSMPGPDYTLTPAGTLAAERMFNVLARFGASSYTTQDTTAAEEFSRLSAGSPTPAALATLASRYPVASVTPRIWQTLSTLRTQNNDPLGGIHALANATRIARTGVTAGRVDQADLATQLSLDLAAALAAQGRPAQALATFATIDASAGQGPLATRYSAVRTEIDAALARPSRAPAIGDRPADGVQVLAGWVLVDTFPTMHNPGGPSIEHVVLFNDTLMRIGLFSITPRGTFELLWDKPYEGIRPSLLRLDHRHVLIFAPSPTGGIIECIDASRGSTSWKSTDVATWFDGLEPRRTQGEGPAQILTPLDGPTRPVDALFFAADNILVMAQRGGRLAAIDLTTGQRMWAAWPRLDMIYDAAVVPSGKDHTLVAIGRRRGVDRGSDPVSALAVLDARSGAILHEVDERTGWFHREQNKSDPGDIRWARPVSGGRVVLGMAGGILCVDPRAGAELWSINEEALNQSTDATVLGDSMVVLARDRGLWLINLVTGSVREKTLERRGKLAENSIFSIYPLPASANTPANSPVGFTVATEHGILCYDHTGELVGADALDGETSMLIPAVSAQRIIAVNSQREELAEPGIASEETREASRIYFYEIPSLRLKAQPMLVMYDDPRAMHLLDGKLLVSTGSLTLVVSLPPSQK
ncbi:MAG: PQQ-binding-like beta-propeller repeat protein [Planctomycetes bacterium]|nr:PQQ-binding-like beta-propeller repeat protein [Planctomycetota bacterium]